MWSHQLLSLVETSIQTSFSMTVKVNGVAQDGTTIYIHNKVHNRTRTLTCAGVSVFDVPQWVISCKCYYRPAYPANRHSYGKASKMRLKILDSMQIMGVLLPSAYTHAVILGSHPFPFPLAPFPMGPSPYPSIPTRPSFCFLTVCPVSSVSHLLQGRFLLMTLFLVLWPTHNTYRYTHV